MIRTTAIVSRGHDTHDSEADDGLQGSVQGRVDGVGSQRHGCHRWELEVGGHPLEACDDLVHGSVAVAINAPHCSVKQKVRPEGILRRWEDTQCGTVAVGAVVMLRIP